MLSLQAVIEATGGRLVGPAAALEFTGVSTDTRALRAGMLFVCLRGDRFDGHAFIPQAIEAGASGLVVASDWQGEVAVPVVRVADTLEAYGRLGRAWRRLVGCKVVAVTGSSGKTSTKEMIAAYLGERLRVAKTEANYNNEVGVPLTLLALPADCEAAVVEMGMRGAGQIAYLADLAEPDVGVVTNVGVAHIELLGSREAIASAKTELWRHMPAHGLAIYPYDDALAAAEFARWGGRGLTFSLTSPEATVRAEAPAPAGAGQVFTVHHRGWGSVPAGTCTVTLPLWGDHHRANALTAIAVGLALGLAPAKTLDLRPASLAGRHVVHEAGGVSIVDDTYNANPGSMVAALEAFASAPGRGRRYAVLGDMGELGAHAVSGHREVGDRARALGLDGLVAVGTLAAHYGEGYPQAAHFTALEPAVDHLLGLLAPGDRVLVKASRSSRLEALVDRLVHALAARPLPHP